MKHILLTTSLFAAAGLAYPAYADISYAPHLPSYVQFSGGPVATLGTIVGGSSYTNGTYNGVPLTGGTCSGVTGNVTVSGNAVTAVTVTNGGAPIGTNGATGCLITDSLTAAAASIGGTGSGFSVPVATVSSFSWTVPSGVTLLISDISGGGGGGGGAQSGSAAGGGGGGSSASLSDEPIPVTPGATLTITPGQPGAGGTTGNPGGNGTGSTLTGTAFAWGVINGGSGGQAGSAGTGGTGGNGGVQGQGNGGAAGVAGSNSATPLNIHYAGGAGGGGGGNTAGASAAGGNIAVGPFAGAAAGTGNGAGGGGGRAFWGDGGRGGNTGAIGGTPAGFGGGGGGGGQGGFAGGPGGPGFVRLRF